MAGSSDPSEENGSGGAGASSPGGDAGGGGDGALKSRAFRGTVWVTGGFGTSQVIRLASNVVLAWLLFPEDFGLMALVLVVTGALEMFSGFGLDAAVIQNERGDEPKFLNVVWTLQVIRGFILWGVALLIAPVMATLYDQPRLAELIPVAAAVCIFRGWRSTKFLWNKRHLRYAYNTFVEVGGQVTGIAAMLLLAWHWRDVWALVYGAVIGAAAMALLSHVALPGPADRPAWDRPTVLELMRFGKWLLVSTILTFFARQLDKILLGLLAPVAVLGVYSIAANLARLPEHVVTRLSESVLFPAFSKQNRARPETLAEKVHLARRTVLLAAVFLLLGMVLLAPLFFRLLYEPDYHDAGWMAQLYCASVWLTTLTVMSARALLARGVTWVFAAANGANAVMTLGGCLLGYELLGVPGFLLGYAFGTLCGYLVVQGAMLGYGMSMWTQDVRFSVLLVALVAVGRLGQMTAGQAMAGHAAIAMEVMVAVVLLGVYGAWAGATILGILLGPRWGQRVMGVARSD